jgi:predicted ThiF/HesA family dinucleotide-utilizing enzyme
MEKPMGLDIAFNREAAIAAGMQLKTERVGSDEEISTAERTTPEDACYLSYLRKVAEYIVVPGTNSMVENGGVDHIVVRANKWGRTYEPLTTWLKANNIEWSEF